jgi:SET domain-containing protein
MRLRRITARRSSVHGKGLFSLEPIAAGERLIEYKGEVTGWRRAAARQRSEVGHTFVFGLSDVIHAFTAIEPGDELFIDYGLAVDGEITDDIRAQYACHCGTSACRRLLYREQRPVVSHQSAQRQWLR